MNSQKDTMSAYNEGLYQIQRINYLWIEANNVSREGHLESWRWILHTIWRELTRDAIKITKTKFNPVEFSESISSNKWFQGYSVLNKKITRATTQTEKYAALHDLEIYLRLLQDEVGKGGKYEDPSDRNID